ncbi:DUF4879 domain-containing protein [Melittangium boletus]|uniref:DUF4879 domain-containing protein n=1 Tax=Melittangium boletus TaxID=83453 RepID=UPI003DA34896
MKKHGVGAVMGLWMLGGCGVEAPGEAPPAAAAPTPAATLPLMSPLRAHPGERVPLAPPSDEVRAQGPAPELYKVVVLAVCSAAFEAVYTPYQCEAVTSGGTTAFNHGGAWMEVITEERGYRAYGSATMAGNATTQLATQNIVDPSTSTLIGYYRWWLADGYASGTFTYTATSINTYQVWNASVSIL